jgi:RNA polymerase sigma factor (TIGR02999 family)
MSEAQNIDDFLSGPLHGQRGGDQKRAIDELFSLVYEELRRLASMVRRNEANATISSTALLHEAWMRLRDSPPLASKSLAHFKAIAARAMRQVLVDEARRRSARKRGGAGEVVFVAFDEAAEGVSSGIATTDEDLLALDAALSELAARSPRQARMVECRFFGGLGVTETAAVLGVSESAIERDWRAARAWLASKIRPASG